jgi:hypothetical protein
LKNWDWGGFAKEVICKEIGINLYLYSIYCGFLRASIIEMRSYFCAIFIAFALSQDAINCPVRDVQ